MKISLILLAVLFVVVLVSGCGGTSTNSAIVQPTMKVGFVLSAFPYSATTTQFPAVDSPVVIKMATRIDPIVVDTNNITVPVVSWEVTCPDGHKFTRKPGETVPFMSAEYVGKYTFIANVYTGGDPMNGGGIHKISGTLTIEIP